MRDGRLRDLDGVLTLGCAAGLALVSFFLIKEGDRRHEPRAAAIAAGTVTHAAQPIRRRPPRTLGWDSLALGDTAFTRDTIFVPPGADAVITLHDGTQLALEENSLLVLETGGKDTPHRLSLERGALTSVPKSGGVRLDVFGKTAELAPGAVMRVDAKQRLDVLDGQVTLGEQRVEAGSGGKLGEGFSSWSATPQGPPPGTRIYGVPATVTLRVRTTLPDLLIEIGQNPERPLVATALKGEQHVFEATKPGTYHWRLIDKAGAAASVASYFVVVANTPPLALVPREQENVVARQPTDPLFFAWTSVDGASSYRVEILRGSEVVRTEKTNETRVAVKELDEGTYTWRVLAERDGAPPSPASPPRSFRLTRKPLPTAPELLDPEVELKRK